MPKRILILGADGYIGWPLTRYLVKAGMNVTILDSGIKRKWEHLTNGKPILPVIDLSERARSLRVDYYHSDIMRDSLYHILADVKPDVIIHLAEQPSAPYSMIDRRHAIETQENNVLGTLNLIHAITSKCSDAHIIKLGSMGEYGTPNIDIEEGWLDVEHKGRKDRVLYPKKPGSFYHLSKVHDSANLEFACRCWGLRVTDLNQGVVYGVSIADDDHLDPLRRTSFHYDALWGTVINRFVLQAVLGERISVYGGGEQVRSFLHLQDVMQCIHLVIENPADKGEFRVRNQYTNVSNILGLAKLVRSAVPGSRIEEYENPRRAIETEGHYYQPINRSFIDLGLEPKSLVDGVHELVKHVKEMVEEHDVHIDLKSIQPTVEWKQ